MKPSSISVINRQFKTPIRTHYGSIEISHQWDEIDEVFDKTTILRSTLDTLVRLYSLIETRLKVNFSGNEDVECTLAADGVDDACCVS